MVRCNIKDRIDMWFDATQSIASTCGSMQLKLSHRYEVRCKYNILYRHEVRCKYNILHRHEVRCKYNILHQLEFGCTIKYCIDIYGNTMNSVHIHNIFIIQWDTKTIIFISWIIIIQFAHYKEVKGLPIT